MKLKNMYEIGKGILKYKITNKNCPLSVIFSITNQCNFRCEYCRMWRRKSRELKTEEVIKLIDEMAEAGTKRIGFTGGEPLIRDNIEYIIDHCRKKKLFVAVGTNGSLIKEKIKAVKKLSAIHISLNGPYEEYMNQDGDSYKKILEGIKIARHNKIPVWTTTVITKNNLGNIKEIIKSAIKYNFICFFQPVVERPYTGCKVIGLCPPVNEYRKTISELMILKKKVKNIGNSLTCLRYIHSWPKLNKINCYKTQLYCMIDTNGDVYPCLNFRGKVYAPNAIKYGFKQSFNMLKNVDCEGCFGYGEIELNNICSFDLETIFNFLKLGKVN